MTERTVNDIAIGFIQRTFGEVCVEDSTIHEILFAETIEERGKLWLVLRGDLKVYLKRLIGDIANG